MDNAIFEKLIVDKIKINFEKSPDKWRVDCEYSTPSIIRQDGFELRVTETSYSTKKPIEYNFSKESSLLLYEVFKDFINIAIRTRDEEKIKLLSLLFQIDRGSKIKKINSKEED
jgi:hypothetical protein